MVLTCGRREWSSSWGTAHEGGSEVGSKSLCLDLGGHYKDICLYWLIYLCGFLYLFFIYEMFLFKLMRWSWVKWIFKNYSCGRWIWQKSWKYLADWVWEHTKIVFKSSGSGEPQIKVEISILFIIGSVISKLQCPHL